MAEQEKGKPESSSKQNLSLVKPVQDVSQFGTEQALLHQFIQSALKPELDYGIIPGTEKKSLWQPGAEKIGRFFNIGAKFRLIKEVEDWDKGFFYYRYRCRLLHRSTGKFVGELERSCNSSEKKYSQYTVSERFATKEQRDSSIGKTTRKGYPALIVLKTPREVADAVNTIQSMAQKRAFVACVRMVTAASDFFASDISDTNGVSAEGKADPVRKNQMKKLHAVATPRGFNEERLHKTIWVMYKKRSRTELTGVELEALTERLVSEFKVVGANSLPERINPIPVAPAPIGEPAGPGKVDDPGDLDDPMPPSGQVEPVAPKFPKKRLEKRDPKLCAQCKIKPAKKGGFCSDSCRDKYYPPKKDLTERLAQRNALREEKSKLEEVVLECGITVYVDWSKEDKCGCGAVIWWAITDKNKKPMPICAVGPDKWDTHFADCPLAKEKRKHGKAKAA